MLSTIIFGIIILHLVVGFGYLIYKLSPTKKVNDTDIENDKPESTNNI